MEKARLCLTTQTYLKSKLPTIMPTGMTTQLHCCKLAISADYCLYSGIKQRSRHCKFVPELLILKCYNEHSYVIIHVINCTHILY